MFEEKNTLYWVIIAFHLITIYIFGSVIRGKKKKKKRQIRTAYKYLSSKESKEVIFSDFTRTQSTLFSMDLETGPADLALKTKTP